MTVFVISLIRTFVPIIVGAVSSYLVTLGLDVGPEAYLGLGTFLTALFSGVYYFAVRLLEQKFPQVGVLLGFAATPDSYSTNGRHEA